MYDLVVIGGGTGGLSVAAAAAKVGARVALVEKEKLGGASTFAAGVPSKGLVQASRLVHTIKEAARIGVKCGVLQIDFPAVMGHIRALVNDFAARDSAESLQQKGIELYHGSAEFEAYDTVRVAGKPLNGQRFVIATGSRPSIPEIPGLAEAGYLDNSKVWGLASLPEHLIVIASEPAGLEMAQCFARLGSKVTVLSNAARILTRDEPEVSEFVMKALSAEGISFKLGVEITKVDVQSGKKVCKYRETSGSGEVVGEVSGSDILVAAGRLANVEGMNLDAVGVHGDASHGIEVDDCLQTYSTRVYALGDVLLRHPYTHVAEREAAIVFQNAVLRLRKKIDYSGLPWATFVDPEVASVGISEQQAVADARQVRVFRVDFRDVDRARIDGRTDGFAKVVTTPAGKVLGATVVGTEAAMIVQEFVLALENGLGLGDMVSAMPVYPSYASVARHLANQFQESRLLGKGYIQTALKLFYGFVPRAAGTNGPANPETESAPEPQPDPHAPSSPGHGHGH
jgi:pyruvate/2-oxoglutarate dehydrogenase complex dihydrolipoamide dehydrogenase (E3) component